MKLNFLCVLSVFLLFFAENILAEEKTENQKTFHSSRLFVGVFGTGEGMNDDMSKGGGGALIGYGVWNIDIYAEVSGYSFKKNLSAETTYGKVDYSQDFEESRCSLNGRYYLMNHRLFAPYVGGHIGVSILSQNDSIYQSYEDLDDDDYKTFYFYGPKVGIQFFPMPESMVNCFLEMSYNKYTGRFKTYEIESTSMMGGWSKKAGDSICLDSISITGGLVCSFF